MDKGMVALFVRTMFLYPAAGAVSAMYGFVNFDEATGELLIDVDAVSLWVAGAIWVGGSGITFAWSRFMKNRGGAT